MRIITVLLALACATVGWAQTDVTATPAQLSVPFGVANGHLAAARNQLVFVNAEAPDQSFSIDRTNIAGATASGNVLTVRTNQPVGAETQFSFRLDDPAAAESLLAWTRSAAPTESAATASQQSARMTFNVRDKRMFRGDEQGKLLVTDDQLIYESLTEVGRSRRWALGEVKELKLKNPYRLVVKPFVGDNYTFTLVGEGMSDQQYREIVGMIARQRTER